MPLLDGRSREREKMCVTARNFVKRAKCKSTKKQLEEQTNKQTNKPVIDVERVYISCQAAAAAMGDIK